MMRRKLAFLSILTGLATIANTEADEPCTIRAKRGLAFAKGADNSLNRGKPGADYTHLFTGYSNMGRGNRRFRRQSRIRTHAA
jgi:hypothetical protein